MRDETQEEGGASINVVPPRSPEQTGQSSRQPPSPLRDTELEEGNIPQTIPIMISDLTATAKIDFQYMTNDYQMEHKSWREIDEKVRALVAWLLSVVSDHYARTCFPAHENLSYWYATLQKTAAQEQVKSKGRAREGYQAAIKPIIGFRRRIDFDHWIENWEKAHAEGVGKNVPDVTDAQFWFSDLERALQKPLGEWVSNNRIHYEDQILNNTLDYRVIASKLRGKAEILDYNTQPVAAHKIQRGAGHAATYGGNIQQGQTGSDQTKRKRDDAPEGDIQKRPKQIKEEKAPQSQPAPDQGTGRKKCQVCLMFGHDIDSCAYIHEDIRQKLPHLKINQLIADLIRVRLEDNRNLATQVERSKANRSTRG